MNWSYIKDRKLIALRAIEFLDNTFYAGTPTKVWRSADGVTWSKVETQSNGARALAYNEQTDTFFAGGHAISRSTDGGNTWEQVFDLGPFYGDAANIMGITCFDDVVVCTGGDMLTLISKDNGATWGSWVNTHPKAGSWDCCKQRKELSALEHLQKIATRYATLKKQRSSMLSLLRLLQRQNRFQLLRRRQYLHLHLHQRPRRRRHRRLHLLQRRRLFQQDQ